MQGAENAAGTKRGTAGVTARDVTLEELIAAKARFLAPMIALSVVSYIGVTALAGFAKGFMALRVVGSLNVGFVLIAFNYVLSWVLALVYVRIANRILDPMVERVVAGTKSQAVPR
jgi:uncharacterized membrane protein (DUF485 family)